MFQRLKGAIDNRIAEEQARQRQTQQAIQRGSPARRRPQRPNGHPARSTSRIRQELAAQKSPDPNEFEFKGEDGTAASTAPSHDDRAKSGERSRDRDSVRAREKDPSSDEVNIKSESSNARADPRAGSPAPSDRSSELPAKIQARLRRLDQMESKYPQLLDAYKTVHAQIQIIAPFEASLREHTPLTSIGDPSALVEYLNQVKLKGDMALEELKRVTAEKDDHKKRFEEQQKEVASLKSEVETLKTLQSGNSSPGKLHADDSKAIADHTTQAAYEEAESKNNVVGDGEKSPESVSPRIGGFSMFSPRFGSKKEEPLTTSEDLFSYDSEVPRLEEELQKRDVEVQGLNHQLTSLRRDLQVARESTEGMAKSLEARSRELEALQVTKQGLENTKLELQKRISDLENSTSNVKTMENVQANLKILEEQKNAIEAGSAQLRGQIEALDRENSQLKVEVEERNSSINILNEKLGQKDHIVKDLEDSLALAKKAEREQASSEKRFSTMQGIMDNLRAQLKTAETTIADLEVDLQNTKEEHLKSPPARVFSFFNDKDVADAEHVKSREDAVKYMADNFGLHQPSQTAAMADDLFDSAQATPVTPQLLPASPAGKKKNNKKKKKGGNTPRIGIDDAEHEGPVKVSEDLSEMLGEARSSKKNDGQWRKEAEGMLAQIYAEFEERVATIETLQAQIKDQEGLQEEIETLRDDLLHQGEEHVEARDALKKAHSECKTLQDDVDRLEKELSSSKHQSPSDSRLQQDIQKLEEELEKSKKRAVDGTAFESALKELQAQFDDLKSKHGALEKDLKAAESLAAARFKDITDLKELLGKAQPELRSLRSEVAELKPVKEALKNKQGELSRLELRHDDLKSEMKALGKRLNDKDTETKLLQQKVEQEGKARSQVEHELTTMQSELKIAQNQRTEAQEGISKTSTDLARAKEDAASLRRKLRDLEDKVSEHNREVSQIKEEMALKSALHASSQSMAQSLRDQTHELSTQAREAGAKVDSLEEELSEAQRMLSERTREANTMRMLLSQAESGTESRIREMKERMDAAIEERDRIEDEASVINRRSMRDVDEAKSKAREAQRQFKTLENEKEELESKARESRRRHTELEQATEAASREVDDTRAAMKGLREALDESERQLRDAEAQKLELRKMSEETSERVDKLTRANKNLTEEMKNLQQHQSRKGGVRPAGVTGPESGLHSNRTSIDSTTPRSPAPLMRLGSSRVDTPTSATTPRAGSDFGPSQGAVDYVYLKNVLLQFMEQKDKNHQRALIPVLAMLLHFDRNDEHKWMGAISSR